MKISRSKASLNIIFNALYLTDQALLLLLLDVFRRGLFHCEYNEDHTSDIFTVHASMKVVFLCGDCETFLHLKFLYSLSSFLYLRIADSCGQRHYVPGLSICILYIYVPHSHDSMISGTLHPVQTSVLTQG